MLFKSIVYFISMLGIYSKKIGTKRGRSEENDCKGETSGREKRTKKESALAASDSVTQMAKTLDSRQQKLFFDVFRDYRDGKLDHHFFFLPREYSAAQFWIILGRVFEERTKARRLDPIALGDLILFGNKLEKDFIKERNKGLNYISPILGQLFSPCDDCQRKIPVFPKCVLEQLGYRTPTRAISRSASASASASGSGSGYGARNLAGANIESARQSQSAEISDSRYELVIKIRESEARNEITMSDMMKLVDMINKWEENVGWMTLLLSAQTHDQFVKYMKGVLDHCLHRSEESEGETSRRGREKRIKEESDEESYNLKMETTLNPLQEKLFNMFLLDYRRGALDVHFRHCNDYSLVEFWRICTREFNKMAQEKKVDTITELEFQSHGARLEKKFLSQKKKGKHFIHPDLGNIFLPCRTCQERIPVFINNALDYLKPRRFRSRSQSRSQSQSRSRSKSQSGAESASVEMANSRSKLITRIEYFEAKDVITVTQMVKLLGMFNNWEENLCWSTLLLGADDDKQFTKYIKAILKEMGW